MSSIPPPLLVRKLQSGLVLAQLNRPSRLNAFSEAMGQEIIKLCSQVNLEPATCKVLLFTGNERAFSSGRDLKDSATHTKEDAKKYMNLIMDSVRAVLNVETPVISVIQGHCIGWGFEFALASDIRIISKNAKFRLPETTLGLFPGAGGVVLLPRLIGRAKASELIFTGKPISGQEAYELGIGNKFVEDDSKALEVGIELGNLIAKNAPLALRAGKKALISCEEVSNISAAFTLSRKYRDPLTETQDHREALLAFAEKRQPTFVGK